MIRWALWMMLAVVAASCNTPPTGPVIAPELDMYLKTKDGRQVRYAVSPAGQLRFSGGNDILFGIWSWTGSITAAQGAELRRIVSLPDWASAASGGGGHSDDVWEITLRDGSGRHSFEVSGNSPGIDAAWAVLSDAGRARLQGDLDRLPRPDIEKLVEQRRADQAAGSP